MPPPCEGKQIAVSFDRGMASMSFVSRILIPGRYLKCMLLVYLVMTQNTLLYIGWDEHLIRCGNVGHMHAVKDTGTLNSNMQLYMH